MIKTFLEQITDVKSKLNLKIRITRIAIFKDQPNICIFIFLKYLIKVSTFLCKNPLGYKFHDSENLKEQK